MSYCTYGYMTCEPFVYWGDIHTEWAEFVRKVDVCDYLGKFRYINDAIEYFDKLEFTPSDHEINGDDLDWDWFITKRGKITHFFGDFEFEKEILFPLSRNSFPFIIVSEEHIQQAMDEEDMDRDAILHEVPDPFETEEQLKEYIRENLDAGEQFHELQLFDIKLRSPELYYEKELEDKNYDQHMGVDALLHFLAQAGVVNRDLQDWLVSFHMVGEDGREFSWARQIVGNEVKNPHEQNLFGHERIST